MEMLPVDNFTKDMHAGEQLTMPLRYLAASSIMGDKVHDVKDEHMEEIADIVIDVTTGKIDYYVVEFGGFPGIGRKYFAIPYSMLRVDPVKKDTSSHNQKRYLQKLPYLIIGIGPVQTSN